MATWSKVWVYGRSLAGIIGSNPVRGNGCLCLLSVVCCQVGVTAEWRKLHNEELNDLYSSPNIVRVIKSRRMRWAGHVARMEEGRGVHKVLVGKPELKRPLGRPRRRWEDNIKMDLEEVGRGCGDWMELAHDRDRWRALVSTVMIFGVP